MLAPTDVDILVSLGYTREIAKKALSQAGGDRAAAQELIRRGVASGGQGESMWLRAEESDWLRGIRLSALPKDRAMRALWRSPVSVHVLSHSKHNMNNNVGDDGVVFRCKVITQTADWHCEKTYEQFVELKQALPLGTTLWFQSSFPQPSPLALMSTWLGGVTSIGRGKSSSDGGSNTSSTSSTSDSSFVVDETTADMWRSQLDDWMHELTLNEKCMTNDQVLHQVLAFVGTGPVTGCDVNDAKSISRGGKEDDTANRDGGSSRSNDASHDGSTAVCSPLAVLSSGCDSDLTLIRDVKKHIRKLPADGAPMDLATFADALNSGPFRVDLDDLPAALSGALTPASAATNVDQLKKDLARDRVVVNGRRFQGGFEDILGACRAVVADLLTSAGLPPTTLPSTDAFTTSLLRQLSRTESAFLSLQCLYAIVDLARSRSSSEGGHTVVPESVLADPMTLRMDLLQRKPPRLAASAKEMKEYCVDVESQASTVYRFVDDATLSTRLQLRIVFLRRTFGVLVPDGGIQEKPGPSTLVFMKETTSTARDWK